MALDKSEAENPANQLIFENQNNLAFVFGLEADLF